MSGLTSPGSTACPGPSPRMLVLCFDGTTNQYGGHNTNVVKLFEMLQKDCDAEQLCYYQTGIGTYLPPGIRFSAEMWIAEVADQAFGWYLDGHVMDGYKFIMRNYRDGDQISLFGFSRGAYTARALAGFLTKIGLLPRDNDEQVTFAYKLYRRTDKDGIKLAAEFKRGFCRCVKIEFLGVWDTVASTGVILSRDLPFTADNRMLKTFRQALSLDERRAKFEPTFWQLSDPKQVVTKLGHGTAPAAVASVTSCVGNGVKVADSPGTTSDVDVQRSCIQQSQLLNSKEDTGPEQARDTLSCLRFSEDKADGLETTLDPQESHMNPTDVKQVWFAGCHSDVGGGAEKNAVDGTLADIPLRWMIREIVASQCRIKFDENMMQKFNVHVSVPRLDCFAAGLGSAAAPGSLLSEQDRTADKIDATKPLHDLLSGGMSSWWLLERIPLLFTRQDAKHTWHTKLECHSGRGRHVNQVGPLLFHETVRIRMKDPTLHYTPAAIYEKGKESYVW